MGKKFKDLLIVLITILLVLFFQKYVYYFINLIGINVNNLNDTINYLINFGIKLILSIIIFFLNKSKFIRVRRNKNILVRLLILFVSLIAITFLMYGLKYVVKYIADIFKVELLVDNYYDIFHQKLTIDLLINIVSYYLLTPFICVSAIILSSERLNSKTRYYIILSGILSLVVYGYGMSGSLLFILINLLKTVILYCILSIIYKKVDSIWATIALYSLYLISYLEILKYFGL